MHLWMNSIRLKIRYLHEWTLAVLHPLCIDHDETRVWTDLRMELTIHAYYERVFMIRSSSWNHTTPSNCPFIKRFHMVQHNNKYGSFPPKALCAEIMNEVWFSFECVYVWAIVVLKSWTKLCCKAEDDDDLAKGTTSSIASFNSTEDAKYVSTIVRTLCCDTLHWFYCIRCESLPCTQLNQRTWLHPAKAKQAKPRHRQVE